MSVYCLFYNKQLLKPLSHQLATSGDALATNNFGHTANASPDIVSTLQLHRQAIPAACQCVVKRSSVFLLANC